MLKGREDMHLDERIMQFLSVVNTVLMGMSSYTQATVLLVLIKKMEENLSFLVIYVLRHNPFTTSTSLCSDPSGGLVQWVGGACAIVFALQILVQTQFSYR